MGRAAAFFDLDRTLLGGASGPVISESLKSVGLLSDRGIPGEALIYRVFNLVGESRPTMQLARQAARFSKGWARETAQEAGQLAAETLVDLVQPFAGPIIDEHRAAGRAVVLATTTPYDLIKPLGWRMRSGSMMSWRRATGSATAGTTERSAASSCGARAS
jgi:putative phosphoserine phosphatase/1-acylglycerol-3-phosphate O-acyltransferase